MGQWGIGNALERSTLTMLEFNKKGVQEPGVYFTGGREERLVRGNGHPQNPLPKARSGHVGCWLHSSH